MTPPWSWRGGMLTVAVGAIPTRIPPGARRRRWRVMRRPVAPPLAVRQHRVGVGLLLEDEPPIAPALGTPAQPLEDTQLAQPLQRRGDGADTDTGLAGDSLVRWIEPAQQRAAPAAPRADAATMPAEVVRAAVEVAGAVPEADGGLLRHRLEADDLCRAVRPHRPGSKGLRQGQVGQG